MARPFRHSPLKENAGGQTSLEVDASCLLSETAELRLDDEDAMVVPLERDLDDQLPPVITPSEQVVQTAGHTISVKQAIDEAVGASMSPTERFEAAQSNMQ